MAAEDGTALARLALGFAGETLNHRGDAPAEAKLEVLLEVGAQILTIERVEHFERLRTGQDLFGGDDRFIARHKRVHSICGRKQNYIKI